MDERFDLLDRRGRLFRIGIALLIGTLVTFAVATLVRGAARPTEDVIGQASALVSVVALFALTTTVALNVITRIHRRLRGPL